MALKINPVITVVAVTRNDSSIGVAPLVGKMLIIAYRRDIKF